MSEEVLERLVKSYMETDQSVYSFGWQGGEPTLMGVEFFEKVVSFQQKHGRSGAIVGNGLQTNATLIDERFAKFLNKYRFLLGCSLDGPADIHDLYRYTIDGQKTHQRVLNGIQHLKQNKVEFNALVLVSQANVKHAARVYDYLIGKGLFHHQYIPCVEFDEYGALQPFAISGEEWGDFLCKLFDLWFENHTRKVSIRHFDAILSKLVEGKASICTMDSNCCQYFLVEYNGDIYPCDFYVEPGMKLGNIMENSWEELLRLQQYKTFGQQKAAWNSQCDTCQYLSLCQGDCLKNRNFTGNNPGNLSQLCAGWQQFFDHTLDRFNQLKDQLESEQQHQQPIAPPANRNIGRNEPCPCGSGKKFKRCCG